MRLSGFFVAAVLSALRFCSRNIPRAAWSASSAEQSSSFSRSLCGISHAATRAAPFHVDRQPQVHAIHQIFVDREVTSPEGEKTPFLHPFFHRKSTPVRESGIQDSRAMLERNMRILPAGRIRRTGGAVRARDQFVPLQSSLERLCL